MLFALLLGFLPIVRALWPHPSSIETGATALWLDPDVQIVLEDPTSVGQQRGQRIIGWMLTSMQAIFWNGNYSSLQAPHNGSSSRSTVDVAIESFKTTVLHHSFVPWRFHPRGAQFEPLLSDQLDSITLIVLTQTVAEAAALSTRNDGNLYEAYQIDVSAKGAVTITAPHSTGLAYGLSTLSQLFYAHSSGQRTYMNLAPVHVADSPKFSHRGLNLDISRSFYPVSSILKTIDGMAYNKLNRLHLHVTDAQAWPLETPAITRARSSWRLSWADLQPCGSPADPISWRL